MVNKAYINPDILKWARISARITEAQAAKKVNVSVEKINEWESGLKQPTIKQAQKLAKAYKRPFALFFLPDVPRDFQPLKDYRVKGSKELTTASLFIIREIQQKQTWISEVKEENNEDMLPFVGRYTLDDDTTTVAKDILNTLDINPLHYSHDNPLLEWIYKSEMNGIFISRTSFIHSRLTLDSEEIQGFAIADPYAPFVFINSDDWRAPQLFTLVHELAHLWISKTGISNEIEYDIKNKKKYHPVELFCNEVAANALIPIEYLENVDEKIFDNPDEVFKASRKLGISTFSFLVKALNEKIISIKTYTQLKHDANVQFGKYLKEEENRRLRMKEKKDRGPNYYLLQINRNSRLFTHQVLDAYHGGYIEPTLASNLLNVKINNFSKLESQLNR